MNIPKAILVALAAVSLCGDLGAMVYRPGKGAMWDPSILWHDGTFYAFMMYNQNGANGLAGGHCLLATSADGVHWQTEGTVVEERESASGNMFFKCFVARCGDRFIMDHGVYRPGQGTMLQDILRFYESEDLRNWKYLFSSSPDPRWYGRDLPPHAARWDHMYILPKEERRPDAGYWGYVVAVPKPGDPPGVGMMESSDGRAWTVLPPAPILFPEGMPTGSHFEWGGCERIGEKYYLIGGGMLGDFKGYSMFTLVADHPRGPFRPDAEAFRLSGSSSQNVAWLAAWCRSKGELLISNYASGTPGELSPWLLPLRKPVVDEGGHLRLAWWPGNEQLKGDVLPLERKTFTLSGKEGPEAYETTWLETAFDLQTGVILEGTFLGTKSGAQPAAGFVFDEGPDQSLAVLLGLGLPEDRQTHVGRLLTRNGASEFDAEDVTGKYSATVTGLDPGRAHRFRLLMRLSLFELYVDDRLMQTYNYRPTSGRLGFVARKARLEVRDLKAWRMSLPAEKSFALFKPQACPLRNKTLVAWVAPANLAQRGGSVLTLDNGKGIFDGIVFGELAAARWMAGSDTWKRTDQKQDAWPAETAGPEALVQIAIVYRGSEVTTYRDGKEYSRHTVIAPQTFGPESVILIGPRHIGNNEFFAGAIDDARVYDCALSPEQLAALRPNAASEPKPWAWWTFDDVACSDHAGRFPVARLASGAKVAGGMLMLDGQRAAFFAAQAPAALDAVCPPRPTVSKPPPYDAVAAAATNAASAALFASLFSSPNPELKISVKDGIGYDDLRHSFQDPSNVVKVGDTYYVWVSWRPLDVHLYNSVIHYATSKDGRKWEQKGLALGKGPSGGWDDWGVLTPYVAQANGRFYMFYTGADRNFSKGSGNAIGLAVADSPEGPWTRVSDKPVLAPSTNPKEWDCHINDDAHVIKRNGKYWLYYKGHPGGQPWFLTRQGVAIADKIEGPYVKYAGNPVITSGHCVCVWPHRGGVAAIGDIPRDILWAEDGLHFGTVKRGLWVGAGPGPYDPDAHTDTGFGRGIMWGVMQHSDPSADNQERNVIARFDLDLTAKGKQP